MSSSTAVTIGIVAFFVVVIVVVLIITFRRISTQRVSLHDGELLTVRPVTGIEETLPTSDIGTVIYIPENYSSGQSGVGVFDNGGIIILNTAGRIIRVIRHYTGSKMALSPIYDKIPAPAKFDYTGKTRRDLLRQFPHAAGFWQLRGSGFVVATILLTILGLFVLGFIVAFLYFAIFVYTG
jgi:hypothetical protein